MCCWKGGVVLEFVQIAIRGSLEDVIDNDVGSITPGHSRVVRRSTRCVDGGSRFVRGRGGSRCRHRRHSCLQRCDALNRHKIYRTSKKSTEADDASDRDVLQSFCQLSSTRTAKQRTRRQHDEAANDGQTLRYGRGGSDRGGRRKDDGNTPVFRGRGGRGESQTLFFLNKTRIRSKPEGDPSRSLELSFNGASLFGLGKAGNAVPGGLR